MKTIAISIDDTTLKRVDSLVAAGQGKNRSQIVRRALQELATRVERELEEERERAILRRHQKRLNRQAAALIRGQARP
jgi:metal-responsive CopG/Arc/MetJ family transcriptional regulator